MRKCKGDRKREIERNRERQSMIFETKIVTVMSHFPRLQTCPHVFKTLFYTEETYKSCNVTYNLEEMYFGFKVYDVINFKDLHNEIF